MAGKEFHRQGANDLPLRRAGILSLVEQHMLNSTIKLEQHPGRVGTLAEQAVGADDQVVKIIGPTAALPGFIFPGNFRGKQKQRPCRGDVLKIGKLAQSGLQASLFTCGKLLDPWVGIDHSLCCNAFELSGLLLSCQIEILQVNEASTRPGDDAINLCRAFIISLAAAMQRGDHSPVHWLTQGKFTLNLRGIVTWCKLQPVPQQQDGGINRGFAREDARKPCTAGKDSLHQIIEFIGLNMTRNLDQRRANICRAFWRTAEYGLPGRRKDLASHRLIHHGEMRNDAGFHREELQEPLAESVNRLNLQSARRLERRGEKPARPALRIGAGIFNSDGPKQFRQLFIGSGDPGAQSFEKSCRHLGRRRLGKCQAKDSRRIGARQHQPDQPVDQNMGLARSGIGVDPGGRGGIGSPELHNAGGPYFVHEPSPARAHSRKRER